MEPLAENKDTPSARGKKQKSKNGLSKVEKIVLTFIGTLVLLLIFDCFDVPSQLGISFEKCNWELQSIIIGNGIVVLLFLLAYLLLDKRNIDKEKNKRLIALVLLKSIYNDCRHLIKLFTDEEFLPIINRIGANPNDVHDPILSHYRMLPFAESNDTIFAFAQDGVINAEEMKEYLELKRLVGAFIDRTIIIYKINKKPVGIAEKDRLSFEIKTLLDKVEKEIVNYQC